MALPLPLDISRCGQPLASEFQSEVYHGEWYQNLNLNHAKRGCSKLELSMHLAVEKALPVVPHQRQSNPAQVVVGHHAHDIVPTAACLSKVLSCHRRLV